MPARMKVLYVTTLHRTGGWLAEAFAADSATQVALEEAIGVTAGLARLRDEVFDAVLVSHEAGRARRAGFRRRPPRRRPRRADDRARHRAVGRAGSRGVRGWGRRLLLRRRNDHALAALDVCPGDRALQLMRENRRLVQVERQRLAQEHQEAERLLAEQRALIAELERIRDGAQHRSRRDAVRRRFSG